MVVARDVVHITVLKMINKFSLSHYLHITWRKYYDILRSNSGLTAAYLVVKTRSLHVSTTK